MHAALGVFLLTDLIYHAVLSIVRHFLGRPLAFGRLFQGFAPDLAANRGALRHSVRGASLGLIACPFPFAFCAHVLPPAFASEFVGAGTEQADTSHCGK